MRTLKLLRLIVVVCSLAATASAQQVGDRIVVTTDKAQLRSLTETTGTVEKGTVLAVKHVNGDWFWVIHSNEHETVKGWINRSDVIPFSRALDFFNEELSRTYKNRGTIWGSEGQLDKAIADFGEAIRLDPKFAQPYISRGLSWFLKKQYDKAIADFDEAIRLDPKNARAYVSRGLVWSNKTQYDQAIADVNKAISDFDEAIRLDPKNTLAYLNRGIAWSHKTQYDKSIADFSEVIRLDPKNTPAYISRGLLWNMKHEYDKAIADFNDAIRLDPKDARAYIGRGSAWSKKTQYDKAIADFNDAIRLDPRNAFGYNHLAMIYATCPEARFRDGEKAVENATQSCELTGWKDWHRLDTLAAAYAEAGDFASAVEWETKARDMASDKDKADFQSRLDLYKAHKPYRQEVKR
jgi:tetratricopeptide (TPR) repeat protein